MLTLVKLRYVSFSMGFSSFPRLINKSRFVWDVLVEDSFFPPSSHLWSREEAGFTPRLVVVEYGENLPFMEDVLVRYTSLPFLAASVASVQYKSVQFCTCICMMYSLTHIAHVTVLDAAL